MSKKLNFAYQWIGPNGPITNNRIPTIADLSWALNSKHRPPRDLLQEPHFHTRFGDDANIVSLHRTPKGKFLYELNFSNYHYRNWRKMFSVNDGPFSDQKIKDIFLPKIVDGKWSGTMCLTESQCGTDLGLIKTKAVKQNDGSYAVTGQKIFITSGDRIIFNGQQSSNKAKPKFSIIYTEF